MVVGLVLAQHLMPAGLVPDEGAVQELRRHPPVQPPVIAFMRGARTVHPAVRMLASARTAPDAAVKSGPLVADHELDLLCLFAGVHQEVACLLGSPVPGGMQGDPEDTDAPGGMPGHGQGIGLGAIGQARR